MTIRVSAALIAVFLSTASAMAWEGDLRVRLQRRFPDCRGTLEGAYAGDEFSFYQRIRFGDAAWRGTLLLDKDRGEEWVDTAAGGIAWEPEAGLFSGIYGGWLKADLGSGLVLSHPGSWGSSDGLALYKPPVIRERIDLASSPTGVRGEPLTGAGAELRILGANLSLLLCRSAKDAVGEGIHRTTTEIAGRGEVTELLSALRVSGTGWGVTAAAASEEESDTTTSWARGGFDWDFTAVGIRMTGEVALGTGDEGPAVALWGALCSDAGNFRHTLTLTSAQEDFPLERASLPAGPSSGTGMGYGLRWRFLPRLVLSAGAAVCSREEGGLFRGAMEVGARLPWQMEVRAGFKVQSEEAEDSWRSWLASSWQPMDRLEVSSRVQVTGWSGSDSLPKENGFGLGVRLKWNLTRSLSSGFSCTAFTTDGWDSRIYSSNTSLPGEFGSSALWGSGFRMSALVSGTVLPGLVLRLSTGHTWKEDVSSMGTGWEETEGGARTELGLQVDYSLN